MDLYDRYIKSLKDNPEGFWFKQKFYGYGWAPAKSQGWVVIGLYILGVVYFVNNLAETTNYTEVKREVIAPIVVITLVLISICYWKGEKSRWQWVLLKEDDEVKKD